VFSRPHLNKESLSRVNTGCPSVCSFLRCIRAFGRTNHNLLFAKLIKCNVVICIVRLLVNWYRHQTTQVEWGTNCSHPFTGTNGLRQGRVLSPYLFAVYLDDLSMQLSSARVGCTVKSMVVNHLYDVC